MHIWTDRLVELGITLPRVAEPVGGYAPAIRSGMHVYTSGQLPFVGGTLPLTGKLGDDVDVAQAADLARTAALNALAAVNALVGLDSVARVIKVTGYVASCPSFTDQAKVINGASTFLHEVFGQAGIHARSAVGVAVLPLNSPVEVELHVELDS
ncbi:RidA family protein [Embleya sp. NPDC005575]|uniref:RidA family protein n=1 Tax=Embleya sp. NPDC005575 TaxID=3156892 RepID=UPI0033B5AF8A